MSSVSVRSFAADSAVLDCQICSVCFIQGLDRIIDALQHSAEPVRGFLQAFSLSARCSLLLPFCVSSRRSGSSFLGSLWKLPVCLLRSALRCFWYFFYIQAAHLERASKSVSEPSVTKWVTSAMWTPSSSSVPPARPRNDSASSTSSQPRGSMLNTR